MHKHLEQEKTFSGFNRFISLNAFTPILVGQLRYINEYISKDQAWNMHLRLENKIDYYYQGNKVTVKIYDRTGVFNVKADAALMSQASGIPFGKRMPVTRLAACLIEWLPKMEAVIRQNAKSKSREMERSFQQRIISKLEKNPDFFFIDMEIAFPKIMKLRGQEEWDMLALQKCADGIFRFVPVELKIADNKEVFEGKNSKQAREGFTAIGQACSFCQSMRHGDNIKWLLKTYQTVYRQKRDIGMLADQGDIVISPIIKDPLVIVIDQLGQLSGSAEKMQRLRQNASQKKWNNKGLACPNDCLAYESCQIDVFIGTEKEFCANAVAACRS